MLPLDTPRAFAVLLALLVATSMATSQETSTTTFITTTSPPPAPPPKPDPAWQEYLRCADERHCVRHRTKCGCASWDFRCWEMCKRRCSCGCLGVPQTILDHDVWDDCAAACGLRGTLASTCLWKCGSRDQGCTNLCRARCRCECVGSRDRDQAESNAV
ncbi:uncharacterized protein LOC113209836 [Frankliniella occidentalis]|uniref:Uncharacterized protein LOC113209836 n=1 Tax=Frankliniella occidentalis TaxID=133901 RepID=A0A6J1SR12_FRAOC|nr:uncharacterized protein LOC113209836 [Frankliniella occidentalis]